MRQTPFIFYCKKAISVSNMPLNIFHASLVAKVLKKRGTTIEREKSKSSCTKIICRITKQGGTKSRIKQVLRKIYGQIFEICRSFSPK